jgi:hypothetical protein
VVDILAGRSGRIPVGCRYRQRHHEFTVAGEPLDEFKRSPAVRSWRAGTINLALPCEGLPGNSTPICR